MKELLVIADQQGGKNTALIRALAIQQTTAAKITVLGFCFADIHNLAGTPYAKLSRNALQKQLVKQRTEQLQQTLKELKAPSKNIKVEIQWSKNIASAIIAHCEQQTVDLVLKTGNKTGNFLYTSTDWQLLRKCPAPVMISASKSWKKKANIIAAVDLATETASKSKLNDLVMQQAKAMAAATGASLHVCFVITLPQPLVDMDIIDSSVYAKNKKAKLQPAITAFCERHELSKEQLIIRQGKPNKIIPSLASKLKAEAVVIGTVGRKGVKGKLLGNTVESILENLRTDIIAVKP
ncbi:universal stress protein [Dasania sp. GY-19]|uniref:Universal stress protein n=1 Tax=Dasania phycosphaerae TaxID=2950436 RepID=A0A9J6RR31_9GAMM|nr:universal stress protein [Dasania phycosphaerae]MCZ0867035.1 universal stress protein [Dasania phycosphaerae]